MTAPYNEAEFARTRLATMTDDERTCWLAARARRIAADEADRRRRERLADTLAELRAASEEE